MSFEEEFDKIIRQKAEDAKYPFDEGSWHKISNMLDGERKAAAVSGFRKLIIPVAALLVVGTVGFFAYTYIGDSVAVNVPEAKLASQEEISAPEPMELKSDENAAIAPTIEDKESKIIPSEAITKSGKKINQIKSSALAPTIAPVTTDKESPVAVVKQDTKAEITEAAVSQNVSGDQNLSSEAKEKVTKNEIPAMASPAVVNDISKQNLADADDKPFVETKQATPKSGERQSYANTEAIVINDEVFADELYPVHGIMPLNQFEFDLKEGYQYPLIKDDDYYNKGKLAKKHYLNLEAGGAYLFGWKQGKNKDGKGFDFYGGLNYGRYINRKLSVSIGLQLYNVSNISKPFYEVSKKEYGFGSTSIYTVVTTNNMLFAAIPLKIYYALNNRNTIALGINAGYLAGANSYVDTYYMRDNEKIYSGTAVNSRQIFEGTKSLNLMITAGYTMRVTNRIAIKGEYLLGLTDLFKNTGNITSSEKTSGVRLGLQYTIFDK